MTAGEIDTDRPALRWCVVWSSVDGSTDAVIVARFLERRDAETWIAVTSHACDVATRCGVLGDVRVVLAYDDEDLEVDHDAE